MGASQLKRLKTALREQGVLGPQKSKKQKRQNAQNEKAAAEKRLQRTEALANIREQFNPFDLKHNARGPKFEVTTSRPASAKAAKGINGRPGVSKSIAEQRRRETLLVEMQRRNKVGGILDRRFGEDDPTMAPEDKMLQRFALEKQRSHKKSVFDLEEDEPSEGLTHMGRSLTFDGPRLVDDFNERDLELGEDESSGDERKRLKRRRIAAEADEEVDEQPEEQPERKKTKHEVMQEVIAKSKLYKHERQAAKEEDEDLRAEIDKELPNLQALLFARNKGPNSQNGAAAQLIAGKDKSDFEKEFDQRVKKLAQEKRAQPTERTKTDEEKAAEASERLKEMEEKRLKRMRGEKVSDDEEEDSDDQEEEPQPAVQFIQEEDDDAFGLGKGIKTRPTATDLGFDDEDDFVIEDDLVASGSELELSEEDASDSDADDASSNHDGDGSDDDDEFTKGLLNEAEAKSTLFSSDGQAKTGVSEDGLPYTFPCPQSLAELLAISSQYPADKLPTIIQRIRSLHHPKLASENKQKLAAFSTALVDCVAMKDKQLPSAVLESVIRHIHSLAKSFPVEIGRQFRVHLEDIGRLRPIDPHVGDLVLYTAVGSIFPTSDHFHQVVTPAALLVARFLGQKVPQSLADYSIGTYLSILVLQYQQLSKRYVPELMNFCLNALCALSPTATAKKLGNFPVHDPAAGIRIVGAQKVTVRRLSFEDCSDAAPQDESHKIAITNTVIQVLQSAADTWAGKESFYETFVPATKVLKHLGAAPHRRLFPDALSSAIDKATSKFERSLQVAHLARRNLELHHHRPLAIRTFIPKFEDAFDPDKHYDPDRERAELAKLRAEHKRERKSALRELRRDAHFTAREKLKVKIAKDAAYEKKYKRLIAEIQGEEGREANAYEREKSARKKARQR